MRRRRSPWKRQEIINSAHVVGDFFSLTAALTITKTKTENKPQPDDKRAHDIADTVCVDDGKVIREVDS